LRAKALFEHYGLNYETLTEECDEWPTWPAIYRISHGEKELIGGYDQLCGLLAED
jgi:glutaredoxin-related protein